MKRKSKGDAEFFRQIAQERDPISYISGIPIGELGSQNFAHVLPKSKYPSMRHDPDNIVILTEKEHSLIDHGTERQREEYRKEMQKYGVEVNWDRFFDKKQKKLKEISNF